MTRNKIEDLRDHLFETIEALKDKSDPMDLDRARTISTVANSIIESAKVEVQAMKELGGHLATDFIPANTRAPALPHDKGRRS
mgnify:CR=1 FL=1